MKRWRRKMAILAGLCGILLVRSGWGQGTVTSRFQNGVSPSAAYAGASDSTLRALTGETFGMQAMGRDLAFDPRNADVEGAGLLQFDVSAIPIYAAISSATLRVRFEPNEFEENSGYLAVFRLHDPNGTGTWQDNNDATTDDCDSRVAAPSNAMGCAAYKRPNVAWTGAGGRVTDVTGGVVRTWHAAGTAEWIEWDVAADMQDFIQNPASNLGWLVQADADDTLRGDLFTCDALVASNRPSLEVVYGLPDEVPPVADAGPDQELTDDDADGWAIADLDGSASYDLDGTILQYAWSTGGVPVATGALAQVALPLGTNLVVLTVADDDSLEDADAVQIVVAAVATNEPPVFDPIGNQTAWVGYELRFSLNASDADGDSVVFTASNLPPGAVFLAPQFSWTPTAAQTGTYAGVGFYADDGHGGTDSEFIAIAVQEAGSGGTTWYVRVDGGSPDQCTGRSDAPYPGSGSNQPCAWDHPFRALPPGGTPRIAGGDTLIIGPGSYRMGYGAPGADACSSDYPWDCAMPPVPGGPNPSNPTRILGAGWASGCTNKPELWGTERALTILDLTGATNVEIGCLEISDHLGCVESHSGGIPCPRDTYPFGDWAECGIYAEDAANVYLHDLDVHGLAHAGIHAGRLTDWTVASVRVAGNGWVGWDGDVDGDDGNVGTMAFTNFTVEWNGCGETYPGGQPTECWAQEAGGYGDGFGTGESGGNWMFDNCAFLHNTSDGLDLLYVTRTGSTIAIRRTIAEGNAGNQLKTSGPATIENCIAVGNCGYFEGQAFTYWVDHCRALGNTLSLELGPGDQVSVLNSTITGEGDCLVLAGSRNASSDGTEKVLLRNNVFLGHPELLQTNEVEYTCLTWGEGFLADPFDVDYSVIQDVKDDPCPVGPHDLCGNPQLVGMTLDAFDAMPLSHSPAIDAGVDLPEVGPDVDGRPRPLDGNNDGTNRWDLGAVEYVHPLADSDGDRMRDADEIAAGTDATDGAALFTFDFVQASSGPILNWWGAGGRFYDVESALESTGAWSSVEGATNLPGADAALACTNLANATRYYRLRVRRP